VSSTVAVGKNPVYSYYIEGSRFCATCIIYMGVFVHIAIFEKPIDFI